MAEAGEVEGPTLKGPVGETQKLQLPLLLVSLDET